MDVGAIVPTGFSPEKGEDGALEEESILDALEPGPKRGPLYSVALASSAWTKPPAQQARGNPLPLRDRPVTPRADAPAALTPGNSAIPIAGGNPVPSVMVLVDSFSGVDDVSVARSSGMSSSKMEVLEAQLNLEAMRQAAVDQRVRTAEAQLAVAQAKGSASGSVRSHRSSRTTAPALPVTVGPTVITGVQPDSLEEVEKTLGEVIEADRAEAVERLSRQLAAEQHDRALRTASGNAWQAEAAQALQAARREAAQAEVQRQQMAVEAAEAVRQAREAADAAAMQARAEAWNGQQRLAAQYEA